MDRRRYRRRPTRNGSERLREVVAHARQVSRRVKEAKWLEWCASFSQHTRLADLWSNLRTATGGSLSRPSAHPRPQQEAERMADTFADRCVSDQLPARMSRTLQHLRLERERLIWDGRVRLDPADCPLTHRKLTRAKRAGRDTATGADGVTYTMVTHADPAGEQGILGLINHSWAIGHLPSTCKSADIQSIPKPKDPVKLRPITLLSCVAETAERMVLNRLQWRLEPCHPHVFGFSRGVCTSDSIMALLNHVDNRAVIAVFLDLKRAFELTCPFAILAALVSEGTQGRLLAWIEDYSQGRRAMVKFHVIL
ncbi:uncharacterized protein LOC143019096 [Oratosquilla oratoria]|uniref:uncharacterized protein LOC143019096 n=1 Tax=Oratosquilla oratoria TaxID=337810 RepID=UPI003F771956